MLKKSKATITALTLLLTTINNAALANNSSMEKYLNPTNYEKLNRITLAEKLGIPQRCWSIKEKEYCNIYFGTYVLFDGSGNLESLHYNQFAILRLRKYDFGVEAFKDIANNGKEAKPNTLKIWSNLLQKKPDLVTSRTIVWLNPNSNIQSIVFSATEPESKNEDRSQLSFKLQRIEINYKK